MNPQHVHNFQQLLKRFYSTVSTQHPQNQLKYQTLGRFLQKIIKSNEENHATQEGKSQRNLQTLTSIGEKEFFQINSKHNATHSSELFYTFLLANQQSTDLCESSVFQKIKLTSNFTNTSIHKVIIYGLFVNHIFIMNQAIQHSSDYNFQELSTYSRKLNKKIKRAMVSAAHKLRLSWDSKKYSKTRYLYQQLVKYSQGSFQNQQGYLQLIIQQFDSKFMKATFDELHKNYALIYSDTIDQIQPHVQDQHQQLYLNELAMILKQLDITVSVSDSWQQMNMGSSAGRIGIVIKQLRDKSYRLKDVVAYRLPDGASIQ